MKTQHTQEKYSQIAKALNDRFKAKTDKDQFDRIKEEHGKQSVVIQGKIKSENFNFC